ncbi:MAG: FHA domain-containing protein [Candidatus Hydrogenedentes bacterium]|nr:FHA domain-containing protein [Candidatus Hydrogenedentota bacterium]
MSDAPEKPAGGRPPAPDRLADLLIRTGVITAKQMEAARALQGPETPNLIQALVQLGFVKEPDITSLLVKQLKIPHLSLQDYQINQGTLDVLPQDLCRRHFVLPIDVLGTHLTVAMVNPLDDAAIAALHAACPGYRLKAFVCSLSEFQLVARRLFTASAGGPAGGAEMSLASLGIAPKPAARPKTVPPAPTPEPPAEEEDVTATQLFDNKMHKPVKSGLPLRSSLICLDGWDLGREIELTGQEHLIGRSPDADTTVRSPLVSREHARITRNEEYGQETFVITDLHSSNGTYVNNIPVTSTILRHGDRVMLGNVLFKFVLLDEIEARYHKDVHHLYSIQKGTGLLPPDAWSRALGNFLQKGTTPLCACLIEIDNLPAIVQARGQIASVIVMTDLGDLLERYLERNDLPGDMGGGRVAVLFEEKPPEAVFSKLEDLRRTVEAFVFHYKEESFRATISAGLTSIPPGSEPAACLSAMESALRTAVAAGRNTVSVAH